MQTAEVVKTTVNKPLHVLPKAELAMAMVSSVSRWADASWTFDNAAPGVSGSSTVYWAVELDDGSILTDAVHEHLLDWLKRFVWSLLAEPSARFPLGPGSMGTLSVGVRRFARWMVKEGLALPSELDPVVVDGFVEDLPRMLFDEVENEEAEEDDTDDGAEETGGVALSFNVVRGTIRVPALIWQQRDALLAAGIAPMPSAPFAGKSAHEIASSVARVVRGWIPPLPDEIAIPVLNQATRMIGEPAIDAQQLLEACLAKRLQSRTAIYGGKSREVGIFPKQQAQRKAAERFVFSTILGEHEPWHPRLVRPNGDTPEMHAVMTQVRHIVQGVCTAAVIVVQSTAGMRISEICGLPAGVDAATGLPNCIRIEESATGLNEVFLCRTLLSKTEETPRNVDWVVGMRPKGSDEVPLAVRAIVVLDDLLAPYRAWAGTDRLLVSLHPSQGLPLSAERVGRATGGILRQNIKDFVVRWVDLSMLPDQSAHAVEDDDLVKWRESKGRIIRTHQFRKMWAGFALQVDPRLLPVIQMHFHHLSQAMTEGGYIGNNRLQVAPLSTVRAQQTNLLMFEMATGKSLAAGRMGEQVGEHIAELRARIQDLPRTAAWRETVRFVNDFDLRLWFAPHGKCLPLVPMAMRCHDLAGTASWLNREPNYSTRQPSVCAGCSCFILDSRHRGFWEMRYVENWVAYKNAERCGIGGQFRVVRDRASQAAVLLTRIGVDIRPLEARVDQRLEEMGRGA